MNKLVRGRIEDGSWVDEEVLWQADIEHYTAMPDMAAGGRIAFDDAGHVFFSVGMKGGSEFAGIQDLSLPYGKIHRLNDDGSVPADNPFVGTANALATIWTYGHRSPQGLEFDRVTRQLWGTEMGQRGGDEVNRLVRGRNYGWPLFSKGLKYDGSPVDYGKELGLYVRLERHRATHRRSDAVAGRVELHRLRRRRLSELAAEHARRHAEGHRAVPHGHRRRSRRCTRRRCSRAWGEFATSRPAPMAWSICCSSTRPRGGFCGSSRSR